MQYRRTLLGISAINKQTEVFKELQKRGADINVVDEVCYQVIDVCIILLL